MTYLSQRHLIRECIVDALLDATVPYAKDCEKCQPVISGKCLGDSPSGRLDKNGAVCCPVYIAVYTDFETGTYDSSQQCGNATLDAVIEVYVCESRDYERECRADELTEVVLMRLSGLSSSQSIDKVLSYEVRTERDTDRIGHGVMLRQIMIKLEISIDHSKPLCDPTSVDCVKFGFVEPKDPACGHEPT